MEEKQQRAAWEKNRSSPLTAADYLLLVSKKSTTANGVSGIKIHYHQFAHLPEKVDSVPGLGGFSPAELLPRLFPGARYLWLTRRDKARQAISFVIAAATDRWWELHHPTNDPTNEKGRHVSDLPFDAALIAHHEKELTQNDLAWEAYFKEQGIEPLVIYYEELAADYEGTMRNILRWLPVERAETVPIAKPRLRRQADVRKEEWLTRYLALAQNHGGN